jgi:hypothetical protein
MAHRWRRNYGFEGNVKERDDMRNLGVHEGTALKRILEEHFIKL